VILSPGVEWIEKWIEHEEEKWIEHPRYQWIEDIHVTGL
jgi:hypothetical protein